MVNRTCSPRSSSISPCKASQIASLVTFVSLQETSDLLATFSYRLNIKLFLSPVALVLKFEPGRSAAPLSREVIFFTHPKYACWVTSWSTTLLDTCRKFFSTGKNFWFLYKWEGTEWNWKKPFKKPSPYPFLHLWYNWTIKQNFTFSTVA